MIDAYTVAKIHDAARIEEVVGDFIALKKRGVNLVGLCPFHNEKTGSFNVSPVRGIFKCFGCGEGGNAVRFIMKHENLSYPDALRYLAKKYNIQIVEKELTEEEKESISDRDNMLNLNDFAVNYFIKNLEKEEGLNVGKAYFLQRGFSEKIIKKFALGYSINQYSDFVDEAQKRGFSSEYITKVGLGYINDRGNLTDRFRGRVMFPIHSISGKVVGFGGRILEKNDKLAKYVNSPESEIYSKSNELYGIFFAKNEIVKQNRCFLVEGYTDVLSMNQAGIENVVASSGTALTVGQIKLINRFTNNITIIYDGDSAGIKASIRGIDILLEQGINVKTLLLPEGEDPDSFAKKNNASDFIEYINNHQVDFIEFKINILKEEAKSDPIRKATMINDMIKTIAIIPNQIIRATYIKECSSRMEIEEHIIYNEINKILRKNHEEKIKKSQYTNYNPTSNEENKATSKKLLNISNKNKNSLYKHEKELIRFIIKDGNKKLVEENNNKGYLNVGEYIYNTLKETELTIETPSFNRILEEFQQNADNPDFNSEEYFKYHQDVDINKIAIEILTDKYIAEQHATPKPEAEEIIVPEIIEDDERSVILHNIALLRKAKEEDKKQLEEEKLLLALKTSLDKVIVEYVNAILNRELSNLLKEIKDPDNSKIDEFITVLKQRYNLITKTLRNRVIIKVK